MRTLKDDIKITAVSLAISATIFTGIVGFIAGKVDSHSEPAPATFPYQLSTKGGEYVWHVAQRCATPDRDVREVVFEIEKASGLKSAGNVQPGQFLRVPEYCAERLTVVGVPE